MFLRHITARLRMTIIFSVLVRMTVNERPLIHTECTNWAQRYEHSNCPTSKAHNFIHSDTSWLLVAFFGFPLEITTHQMGDTMMRNFLRELAAARIVVQFHMKKKNHSNGPKSKNERFQNYDCVNLVEGLEFLGILFKLILYILMYTYR